jgi:hypothetical protein
MDQRHEQIANVNAVQRAVKEGVLSVQYSALQTAFDDTVVQRGPSLPQERGERPPVTQQIRDRPAQTPWCIALT